MTDFRPATIQNINLGTGQYLALSGYKLGIAAKNRERAKHQYDEVMDRIVDRELVQRAVDSTANCFIQFKNGSTIDIFTASDNARGKGSTNLLSRPTFARTLYGMSWLF